MLLDVKGAANRQHALATQKADCTLGSTKCGRAAGRGRGAVPLCPALTKITPEVPRPALGPQHKADVGLLERGQRRLQGCSEAAAPLLRRFYFLRTEDIFINVSHNFIWIVYLSSLQHETLRTGFISPGF